MIPASHPRAARAQRLLHIQPSGGWADTAFAQLPGLLRPGDVLVLNDAATVPASLRARVHGASIELRLVGRVDDTTWQAVLFGGGSWRDDTDGRPTPPPVAVGDRVDVGALGARVEQVGPHSARLVTLRFDRSGAALWAALYALGRPVQYSYLDGDLELASVQTVYAGQPWAVEMPSAGRPLTVGTLAALRRRGVELATVTHAAGLSSTGDPLLDRVLPLPERTRVPEATARAINGRRGRVVAVGTSVARALETAAVGPGRVAALDGVTDLIIEPSHSPMVVDGLLSGMHEPGESHFRMHQAFAGRELLLQAHAHAVAAGYHNHEFGDSVLVLQA